MPNPSAQRSHYLLAWPPAPQVLEVERDVDTWVTLDGKKRAFGSMGVRAGSGRGRWDWVPPPLALGRPSLLQCSAGRAITAPGAGGVAL